MTLTTKSESEVRDAIAELDGVLFSSSNQLIDCVMQLLREERAVTLRQAAKVAGGEELASAILALGQP